MELKNELTYYSDFEEKLNVYSHGAGIILSVIGCIFLIIRAFETGYFWSILSFLVFGFSLIILYAASTIYHRSRKPLLRYRLNILDHAAIYVLIAGTYTPFALVTIKGTLGWVLFFVIWGLALTGIILKIFYIGRFNLLSTLMYIAMGWLILVPINSLLENLHINGLIWVIAGGISYTIGAVFYLIQKIPLNHAIFHIFVLMGSFSHFMAVYFYVVP